MHQLLKGSASMADHLTALEHLLAVAQRGGTIAELQAAIGSLINSDRSDDDLADWRLRRGKLKKVCDEIIPVARLFRFLGESNGRAQFPLDDHVPDCWWQREDGQRVGIEVTISQGQARHILGTELVQAPRGSIVRGFIDLQDGKGKKHKQRVVSVKRSSRAIYSSEQALMAVGNGLRRCLDEKNREVYRGMLLVIEAPLDALPAERWKTLQPALATEAASSPFEGIYVLGSGERLPALRLK
jgi:hypothetical protein